MVPLEPPPQRSPPCPKSRRGGVRYARVSRATPDRLFARIVAIKPTTSAATSNETWVLNIFHGLASTTSIYNPKRKKMVVLLEKAAERAEAAAAARTKEVKMATPAVNVPVARQETQVLKEPARSDLVGEVSQWLVCNMYVPPCALE